MSFRFLVIGCQALFGPWLKIRSIPLQLGAETVAATPAGPAAFVRVPVMKSARLIAALLCAQALLLALAPTAMAADGVGLAGRVGDKTITLVCFGVIAFFPILVITLSIIQGRLEARKDRRRYDLERLS
jgi:hypothetical protein